MTGPWARYGREDSPVHPYPDESVRGPNPYLRGQPAWPASGGTRDHDSRRELRGPDTYWPDPAGRTAEASGSPAPNPYPPNPYVRDPYLPNPHSQNAHVGQPSPPNPYLPNEYGQWPGRPPGTAQPARPPGRDWSLIAAVVVMVIIVVAASVILFTLQGTPTAVPPASAPATSGPRTAGAPPDRATTAAATPSVTAVLAAARQAATAWVNAINRKQVSLAKELSCAAVVPEITAAFVKAVAGSLTVTSVTVADPTAAGAVGTLNFSYQKTGDVVRQHDHLALVVESGRWKVCG